LPTPETNVPPLLAILIAMAVQWCNTARITQWRRSRAFIKASKRRHWATTRSVLPRQLPGDSKQNSDAKCVHFADHFDGRGCAPVLYRVHHPMGEVHGFHNAATGRALALILPIGHANTSCFFYFIIKKGSS